MVDDPRLDEARAAGPEAEAALWKARYEQEHILLSRMREHLGEMTVQRKAAMEIIYAAERKLDQCIGCWSSLNGGGTHKPGCKRAEMIPKGGTLTLKGDMNIHVAVSGVGKTDEELAAIITMKQEPHDRA
jgi:hypothetical protein